MEQSLFQSTLLSSGSGGVELPRPWVGDFEFSRNADYLAVCLVLLVLVWLVDTNITRSRPGRAFQAIRADEDVAASFAIDVRRHKLMAFTISGAFAGLAGAMYGHLFQFANAQTYRFDISLLLVIMVVVGGLGSRVGVVTFAAFFGIFPLVLDEIWGNDALGWELIVGALLLLVTIARNPSGLAGAVRELQHERAAKAEAKAASEPGGVVGDGTPAAVAAGNGDSAATDIPKLPNLPPPSGLPARPSLPAGAPLLVASDVTVDFGGLRAVDGASIAVRPNRIVGLIGPNGAGKTTLFNVITGVVTPTAGAVELMGTDVTDRPAHSRAALGMGRTFQHIGLAPDLSVTENLLLAQHQVAAYPLWSALLGVGPAPRVEDELRARAAAAVEALSFGRYADTPVKNLSHGQQRIVEIGSALVTSPELLLLDEPSAGMAPAVVENLGERLRDIRDELDRTVLLIEHNIPLVLDVCDELYVMAGGRVIAHGPPQDVVQQDDVITSYLGEAVI
jgi:branched-chain amino acid transport system permease protein